MSYRNASIVAVVLVGTVLTVAFPAADRPSATRWIVPLQNEQQLNGLRRAAEARQCVEHHQTDRFISFNCPQGKPPTPEAQAATQYVPHDSTTNDLIRANDVHAGIATGPFDGSGVRVAVVDSGADTDHPALQGVIEACVNTTGDPNGCEDLDGHGTATTAIIAGIAGPGPGVTSDSTAPGASIISVKVFPDSGAAIYSDDVAVALLLAVSYTPDVINLSVGGGKSTAADCDASGDPAVDVINIEAANAGIAVVVSSGNDRFKDGISFPACASRAIAVGAVYQRDEGRVRWLGGCMDRNTAPDLVTCFSNSGPALDVVAPGAFLWTAQLGGGFDFFHGTSAAAPVVAGAAALLKQQAPSMSSDDVLETLRAGALELGSAKNQSRNGDGRIDSVLAADYADANFQVCGSDTDCDDGNLCNGAETCDAGNCLPGSPLPSCDDGNPCNGLEACDPPTGACQPGSPPSCDDANACTDDSCTPGTGCVHTDNGTCPTCTPVSKGRCNCDGICKPKEARYGNCADCF